MNCSCDKCRQKNDNDVVLGMKIDQKSHKVDPKSLTKEQAEVFIVFLQSEISRHMDDVQETGLLIHKIKERFGL